MSGARGAATRFVVLASLRSGSTLLVDLLNDHPDVRAYGEVFLGTDRRKHEQDWNAHLLPEERYYDFKARSSLPRPFSTVKYLGDLYRTPGAHDALGFKLMYTHLREHIEILPYLLLRRCKIIHLVRTNTLEQALSSQIAGKTAVYHSTQAVRAEKFHLDPGEVVAHVKRLETRKAAMSRWLRVLPLDVLTVSYEALRDGRQSVLESVFRHLSVRVPETPSASGLTRTTGAGTASMVSNYAEVASMVSAAGYGCFLSTPTVAEP